MAWALALALVGGLAMTAAVHWHRAAAHDLASVALADKGARLASRLAAEAANAAKADDANAARAWTDFSATVRVAETLEGGLEYVQVRQNGVTLFAEGSREWKHLRPDGDALDAASLPQPPVRMSRTRVGAGDVEVVSFDTLANDAARAPVELSLGIRRAAIDQEESPALRALDSLYHLVLWAGAALLLLAAALLAWVLRRDDLRETARHREEHLAFSGVLANGIVHDFRNPMSALRLDAQMLEFEASKPPSSASPERITALSARMRHTLDRMEKILQEFLALARPDSPPPAPTAIDLAALARETADILAPRAAAASVTVTLDLPATPLPALATPTALHRAFSNVLLNAIQHAGPGGHVLVTQPRPPADAAGAPASRLPALDIWNTGDTIPPAARERIFDLFFTTRPEGTGLGLFLARTALEKSGGRLDLLPAPPLPGYATGFRLSLPPAPTP